MLSPGCSFAIRINRVSAGCAGGAFLLFVARRAGMGEAGTEAGPAAAVYPASMRRFQDVVGDSFVNVVVPAGRRASCVRGTVNCVAGLPGAPGFLFGVNAGGIPWTITWPMIARANLAAPASVIRRGLPDDGVDAGWTMRPSLND